MPPGHGYLDGLLAKMVHSNNDMCVDGTTSIGARSINNGFTVCPQLHALYCTVKWLLGWKVTPITDIHTVKYHFSSVFVRIETQ